MRIKACLRLDESNTRNPKNGWHRSPMVRFTRRNGAKDRAMSSNGGDHYNQERHDLATFPSAVLSHRAPLRISESRRHRVPRNRTRPTILWRTWTTWSSCVGQSVLNGSPCMYCVARHSIPPVVLFEIKAWNPASLEEGAGAQTLPFASTMLPSWHSQCPEQSQWDQSRSRRHTEDWSIDLHGHQLCPPSEQNITHIFHAAV